MNLTRSAITCAGKWCGFKGINGFGEVLRGGQGLLGHPEYANNSAGSLYRALKGFIYMYI